MLKFGETDKLRLVYATTEIKRTFYRIQLLCGVNDKRLDLGRYDELIRYSFCYFNHAISHWFDINFLTPTEKYGRDITY